MERIEELEQDIRDVAGGFRMHYNEKGLLAEQRELVSRLSRAERLPSDDRPDDAALLAAMLAMAPKSRGTVS